jgi:hypothetical protein
MPQSWYKLISHNHYDYLDVSTIKALEAQSSGPPLFAVPLGIDIWIKDLGVSRVERFDWWDTKTLLGSWLLIEGDLPLEAGINVEPAKSLFLRATPVIQKTSLKSFVDSDQWVSRFCLWVLMRLSINLSVIWLGL